MSEPHRSVPVGRADKSLPLHRFISASFDIAVPLLRAAISACNLAPKQGGPRWMKSAQIGGWVISAVIASAGSSEYCLGLRDASRLTKLPHLCVATLFIPRSPISSELRFGRRLFLSIVSIAIRDTRDIFPKDSIDRCLTLTHTLLYYRTDAQT